MGLVNGINTTSIIKCNDTLIGSVVKMNNTTMSAPLVKQAIRRDVVSPTSPTSNVNRVVMLPSQEPTTDLRLTETTAFTVNLWVKVGWTSSVNTVVGLLGLAGEAISSGTTYNAYNNTLRIFYTENNNRLYIGWLNQTSGSNRYAQAFWPLHVRPNTGLGSTYWSSSNRGNVNSNGYTMLTFTVAGTTSGSSIMSRANVKGYWNTTTIGDTWVANGEQSGDPNLDTTTPRGMALGGLSYSSGTFTQGAGSYGGNGTGILMDEVSIWNGILTSSEISALYNSGNGGSISKTSKPSNLKAYWNFDSDSTGIDSGSPFAYPVWPAPAVTGNLGKAVLSGTSAFVSGGTNIIS